MKFSSVMKTVLLYIFLIVSAVGMVFPFFWMFVSSLKTAAEVSTTPPTIRPAHPSLENYAYAFDTAPFAQYFLNSIIVTIACVGATVFTSILAAFAFSRLKFPGRDLLFSLLLSLMMVPFEMLIITNYSTIVSLHLVDHLAALILPFTSSIFNTYILRNFFQAIPDSLYWSARTDGASSWQYLWNIMVPIAKPAIVTVSLLNAITCWNSFLWSILVISSTEKRTLPFGLFAFTTQGGIRYERLMAAATIVVLPMVILFIVARKSIVTGVAQGGLKG